MGTTKNWDQTRIRERGCQNTGLAILVSSDISCRVGNILQNTILELGRISKEVQKSEFEGVMATPNSRVMHNIYIGP